MPLLHQRQLMKATAGAIFLGLIAERYSVLRSKSYLQFLRPLHAPCDNNQRRGVLFLDPIPPDKRYYRRLSCGVPTLSLMAADGLFFVLHHPPAKPGCNNDRTWLFFGFNGRAIRPLSENKSLVCRLNSLGKRVFPTIDS